MSLYEFQHFSDRQCFETSNILLLILSLYLSFSHILCGLELADDRFNVSFSRISYSVALRALNSMPQMFSYLLHIFTCNHRIRMSYSYSQLKLKSIDSLWTNYLLNEFFFYFKRTIFFFILSMFPLDFVILCRSASVQFSFVFFYISFRCLQSISAFTNRLERLPALHNI